MQSQTDLLNKFKDFHVGLLKLRSTYKIDQSLNNLKKLIDDFEQESISEQSINENTDDSKKLCEKLIADLSVASSDLEKCATGISVIQDVFLKTIDKQYSNYDDMPDRDKMFKTILTRDMILERIEEFINSMEEKQSRVCAKYCSPIENLKSDSIPNDIFELMELLCCNYCGKPEDSHEPCSFFKGRNGCSTCGLSEYAHIPCGESDISFRDYDGKCTKCGTNKYCHDKYNKEHNKCCFNYSGDGKQQCTNCKFDMMDHVWNEQVRNLSKDLKQKVQFAVSILSIDFSCNAPMFVQILYSIVYVPEHMDLLIKLKNAYSL